MDYFISFNGHLEEGTRPEGWPTVVKDKAVFRVTNNVQELVEYLNNRANQIKRDGGMTINSDELEGVELGDDLESEKEFGKGLFIPMHMISYLTYTIKKLVTVVPDPGKGLVM